MSRGPRYVEIPADRLLGLLRDIGAKVTAKGGAIVEGTMGREVVVDLFPPHGRTSVRIFTSLASGADAARDCGEDAVRIVLGTTVDGRWRPLGESEKILRTAPRDASDRVGVFLERLKERARGVYLEALNTPACPACGRAMGIREARANGSRFWGCCAFPECRGTRPVARVA